MAIKEHAALTTAKLYRPYVPGNGGVYVSVEPRDVEKKVFSNWIRTLFGQEDEARVDDLHCTVVWSKVECEDTSTIPGKMHIAQFTHFEYWDGHDKDGYLVAVFDSPDLRALHQKWLDRGCVHSFPDYLVHVTLKSKFRPTDDLRERMLRLGSRVQGSNFGFVNETAESLK